MKPVRIFRHVACEGPGYLGTFLNANEIPYEVICIDEGINVPQQLDDVSGLIFMGGSMNVTDPLQWVGDEKKLIRNAIAQNIPVMGICLGAQLMSAALDGKITHDQKMEIGWHAIEAVDQQHQLDWLNDLPDEFIPFHWHADTFSIPEGATALFNSHCRNNQAFVLDNNIAMQFHLEMTIEMVEEWVRRFGEDLTQGHSCVQNDKEILLNLEKRIENLHIYADVFYGAWINGLKN